MENEELENINSQIDDTETVDSPNDEPEESEQEGEDSPQEEYTDREKQMYARMKKAEGFVQVDGKWVKPEKSAKAEPKVEKRAEKKTDNKLSIFDQKAIFEAKIDTQEDLDELLDYADRKGLTIKDALNSSVIKATFAENAEKRQSANAVNTGTGRRATGVTSDERLLSDANSGKLPDSPEDIARLARLKFQKK